MIPRYYIDGYNVIHHWPELQALARRDLENARDTLIDNIARFCAVTNTRAAIVFDGRGPKTQTIPLLLGAPEVEVLYSPRRTSADVLIQQQVRAVRRRAGEIVVVSADRLLGDLCRAMGAFVVGPGHFLAMVGDAMGRSRAELRHAEHHAAFPSLEGRLSAASLTRLQGLQKRLRA